VATKHDKEEMAPLNLDRRSFAKGGLAALFGLWMFGDPALGSAMDISFRRAEGDAEAAKATKITRKQPGVSAAPTPEIVKPFLNERLEFNLSFLSINTAKGTITFKNTGKNQYTASVEGNIVGVVGAITTYRKVVMTSVMFVDKVDGKERFVSHTFYRKTIKTEGEWITRYDFNYRSRKYYYTKTKNGKRSQRKVRRVRGKGYYDDFVAILYNFRAHVYGQVKPGFDVVLKTLPMSRTVEVNGKKVRKKANTVRVIVPSNDKLSADERKWLKSVGADFMAVVKIDKDVYDIKSGESKFGGVLATMEPRGSWAEDVWVFGDVKSRRTN
jgi:Protein of unknown function (DUF3108)